MGQGRSIDSLEGELLYKTDKKSKRFPLLIELGKGVDFPSKDRTIGDQQELSLLCSIVHGKLETLAGSKSRKGRTRPLSVAEALAHALMTKKWLQRREWGPQNPSSSSLTPPLRVLHTGEIVDASKNQNG